MSGWKSATVKIELANMVCKSTKPKARSSWEPSSDSNSYEETCNNTVDHRIAGVPLSAVEPQNTIRENKVKRLIEKFEKHKNKDSLIQDLRQTEKMNEFSKESQDLIADMNNTEIFEFCENSSKQQCPDCNAYWEMGIIYCSCGRTMKSTRSPTEFDQNNRDVTSILGYVIKKNRSRGAKHGASERQKMYFHAKQMLEKTQKILKEELSFHAINDPTLFKRKENANDYMTSTWQEPNKNTLMFLAVNKYDSEKDNYLKATKTLTTPLTRKQVGGSTDSRGET